MSNKKDLQKYMSGFGNHFSTEAIPESLPIGQNSPQKTPYGLYAEQISGSAFTMLRHQNLRTWLYRMQPSVVQEQFLPYNKNKLLKSSPFKKDNTVPNPLRWDPLKTNMNSNDCIDFIDGSITIAGNGDHNMNCGGAIHVYNANSSMQRFFSNNDGDMLIIPQDGSLYIKTEMGNIELNPLEIAVIPRGIKFQVLLQNNFAYGYVCENYGHPFKLPDLGPIGANGLANPRDFLIPCASFEDIKQNYTIICKFNGSLWEASIDHSPLDVVAWHGNYTPYKYDLRSFNTIGSISFDHPDPSIFTVLTSASAIPGMANIDFVIFPPRYLVARNTFRPPWFHRNIMSEFMGLIQGTYDAKDSDGFKPGGASLHNKMVPHGPDSISYQKAVNHNLKPQFLDNTMAFMLESSMVWNTTNYAMECSFLQQDYIKCWQDLPRNKF